MSLLTRAVPIKMSGVSPSWSVSAPRHHGEQVSAYNPHHCDHLCSTCAWILSVWISRQVSRRRICFKCLLSIAAAFQACLKHCSSDMVKGWNSNRLNLNFHHFGCGYRKQSHLKINWIRLCTLGRGLQMNNPMVVSKTLTMTVTVMDMVTAVSSSCASWRPFQLLAPKPGRTDIWLRTWLWGQDQDVQNLLTFYYVIFIISCFSSYSSFSLTFFYCISI